MNRKLNNLYCRLVVGALVGVVAVHADGAIVSFDAFSFPEVDPIAPWSPTGTIDVPRWLAESSFFHELIQGPWPLPHGEQDFYRRAIGEFTGGESWYLEWMAQTNGSVDAFPVNGPSIVATSGGGSWYHLTFADNQLRFFRDPILPEHFFDLEAGVAHVIRLEIKNPDTYSLFIDGELVETGVPESVYPTSSATLTWGSRFYFSEHTTEWDYIRYGGPIPDAGTGDFDTNGAIELRDFFFFTEYLSGPDIPHAVGWAVGDMEPADSDADIDLADYAEFQNVFTSDE